MTNPKLTARELEIVTRVSYGLTNDEIGHQLYIAGATVKTHLRRIFQRFGARDRAQLVRTLFEMGLLRSSDPVPAPTAAAADWVAAEMLEEKADRRPLSDRHIGACFAARACPCREGSTWTYADGGS